ncbi:multidrug transporter AcrB [Coxiella-like endosymbiont of Rhipicephalus sanguineus]|uniref:efflux RND transporter permease subunit n=1 Tax=Coxiella-like endosymbiont of Rhipicephalus sanguineus TaxID=1955402 RepID=UPI00203C078E|nr:efflux RND transporter permease subunit [Coxiella-like endosymbiont of Rhipicephalus sanguineus]MBT8506281.1 multidrug transporter AcrB [Coxiella-like endosymbiont of Rhipicephalus sanguineus]
MKLSEICISQPVLAIVLSLILVVLGIVSFQRLELRFFPKLQLPTVTVATSYEGASAELMESQVTTQIENALLGVDHVAAINSTSYSGSSYVTVLFRLGGNFEEEANAVRDKVFGIRDKLPPDANPSTITVGSKGSPVLGVGFIDPQKSSADIRDYVERTVQPALRQLPGMGEVDILGASDYAMRIWLDASKMVAYQVTVTDVKNALTANNIYFPAGSIQEPKRNFSIVSHTQLKNAAAFGNIIIKHTDGGTVRLNDIGHVELGYRSLYQAPMRINGQNGIEVLIEPLQEANPIIVAHEVKQAMIQIQESLPPGMQASVNYDPSTFLKSAIEETFYTMGEAVILVILVVFLFLGSARAASIPIITIPVSLIGVFAFIALLGFTINTMSLLGIVLAIGLVVDDAIVMLENIHRHIEEGMTPMQAAIKGSREITFPVIAMALTLVAVYAPIGFVQGFTAELFKEFAFTLAAAVIISAFVALTLSPMMCSRILLVHTHDSRLVVIIDRLFFQLANHYQRLLKFALSKRRFFVIALIFIAGLGYLLFISLPSELIPKEDIGLIQVSVTSPSGASLNYTDQYAEQIEHIIKQNPAVASVISQVSTSSVNIRVTLKPWGERKETTEEVIADLNPKLGAIPGIDTTAYIPDIVNYGLEGNDINLNFMTGGDYMDLLDPINKMVKILKQYPGVMNVHTNLKYDTQQYAITIKRDLAAVLGVNIQDIADTVSAMMSGNHWTDVQAGNKSYEVIVQMQKDDLSNFNALRKLYVRSSAPPSSRNKENMIPVSSLINLTPTVGQGNFTHYDRFRSGTISARLSPGYCENQVINYIKAHLLTVLISNVHAAFSGKAAQFLESSQSIVGIVIMSFILIYLMLSAQFGSFIDPLIILLAVPLSIVGGLLSLKLAGGTFSIYSQIGLVTLIGMISKHGILITQFINDLRKQGVATSDAIIEGTTIRLRPILMTTMGMVFGALPLALATGAGSIGRHQIGWVIVGGLLFGTFFSLIVVPIAYSYFVRFEKSLISAAGTR